MARPSRSLAAPLVAVARGFASAAAGAVAGPLVAPFVDGLPVTLRGVPRVLGRFASSSLGGAVDGTACTSAARKLDAPSAGPGAADGGAKGTKTCTPQAAHPNSATAAGAAPVCEDQPDQQRVFIGSQQQSQDDALGSGDGSGGGSTSSGKGGGGGGGSGGDGSGDGSRSRRFVDFLSSLLIWAIGLAGVTSTALAVEHLVPGLHVPTFALLMPRSTAPPEEGIWTTREEVEQHFHDYLRNPSQKVLIVAGPKGTGKSTAALHAVRDVHGTAYVSLSGEDKLSESE
ncbi:hypothetical protein T492DRAFT_904693 [Pavlovales sp. CCMP2436]|nr:hypothetical protein T492DRAFT_904693 [Pavlovales sp. CCMP2436]